MRLAEALRLPVYPVKRNTTAQIRHLLRSVFNVIPGGDEDGVEEAVREAEAAVARVKADSMAAELAPRSSVLRKLQHRIVVRHGLMAESIGNAPHRRLVIYPA